MRDNFSWALSSSSKAIKIVCGAVECRAPVNALSNEYRGIEN